MCPCTAIQAVQFSSSNVPYHVLSANRTLIMLRGNLFANQVVNSVRSLSTRKKYPKPLRTRKSGIDILHDPLWNKSLAFSYSERDRLGIRGLIPPAVRTIEGQVMRCMDHLRSCADDAAKNLYLQDLHNRNETLYHRLLVDFVSSTCNSCHSF